jgi:hypothetical protein
MEPANMFGRVLFPLNRLKTENPATFEFQASKYRGRESLMEERIPMLDCKWNDVLHLAPIDPRKVYQAVTGVGISPDKPTKWFKIPISKLNPAETVIFKYEREDADLTPDQVISFDASIYSELSEVPLDALEWYRHCADKKRKPLLFHRIAHVMTRTPIDIQDCELIDWSI